jgi:alpha-glucosidase
VSYRWWQRGIIYEVYIRSFQDSDGDGIGDLSGVIDRLDYLVWLGVDALWLTPFYPSPQVDMGYDVANYIEVDPTLGTLAVFDRLVAEAHSRNLRVIVDLVPNHTSDGHPWFVDALSSRNATHRDWYIWRDPAPGGGPPNNWLSEFGDSAWQLDGASGQYYLHSFAIQQPDLNWRNRAVRQAIYDVMRFWLDRGVDGFRVDVMWYLIKDERWRDNPLNPDYVPGRMKPHDALVDTYASDQPEVHEVIAEMRSVLDEYEERVMIGEVYLPVTRLVEYYGRGGDGAHLPFNFHLITDPWDARGLQVTMDTYEGKLPANAWPNWVIGNHDVPRIASRVGEGQARVAAMLLLSLRGTPTMYYGDELGMPNGAVPPELMTDPRERNTPGHGFARDPYRIPMAWDGSPSAGFTTGRPWLPTFDRDLASVEQQREDPGSFLALYRRLIELRRHERTLQVGRYAPIVASGDVIAFRRILDDDELLVAVNLGHEPQRVDLPWQARLRELERLAAAPASRPTDGPIELAGDDGVIARVLPDAEALAADCARTDAAGR